jgi:hypothetical protein
MRKRAGRVVELKETVEGLQSGLMGMHYCHSRKKGKKGG